MKRFVEGQDRSQLILLPDCLEDYVGEDNPVRIVDAFIDELDLAVLGFAGVIPEATGRPSYHPVTLLKNDAEHDHYTCPAGAKLTKIQALGE
jgi:transposase